MAAISPIPKIVTTPIKEDFSREEEDHREDEWGTKRFHIPLYSEMILAKGGIARAERLRWVRRWVVSDNINVLIDNTYYYLHTYFMIFSHSLWQSLTTLHRLEILDLDIFFLVVFCATKVKYDLKKAFTYLTNELGLREVNSKFAIDDPFSWRSHYIFTGKIIWSLCYVGVTFCVSGFDWNLLVLKLLNTLKTNGNWRLLCLSFVWSFEYFHIFRLSVSNIWYLQLKV